MKTYIFNTINYDKLNEVADMHEYNFLIMNKKTLGILISDVHNREGTIVASGEKAYPEYRGVPIATCEKLDDGEVEAL